MSKTIDKPYSTRLPDNVRADLQTLAKSKGLTESDLGRMFIMEGLARSKPSGANTEHRTLAALVIAALSDTIDFEQAQDLVEQHLPPKGAVSP